MATTLPPDGTKTNSDAATDDPKQSILVDVAGAVDMENLLKAALGQAAQLNVSDGLEIGSQSAGTPDDLKVRLRAVSAMLRSGAGLAVDIAAFQKQSFTAVDDAGAADAVALTISPAIAAYVKYQAFMAVIVATNTTATTININALGTKALKKWKVGAKVALEAGDLIVGMIAHMVFDGTDVILLNPPSGEDYIQVRDEKVSGTDGGTFTSGAWRTRDLNTESADTGNHASVASNQITLAAGTYRVRASALAFDVDQHQLRLQNIDDATTIVTGLNARANATNNATTRAHLNKRFMLSAQKIIELQHRCETTKATVGFGQSAGWGTEIYAEIEFWKER